MKKTNYISQFEDFKPSVNESMFNRSRGITAEMIGKRGLESVITEDFFLDLWFDSYFKNTSGDSSYDYRNDQDFWNHTDEILSPETEEEIEILNNPLTRDSYHDHHWAEVLNYIISQRPNPLTEEDALENAIDDALSGFKSSRRYS